MYIYVYISKYCIILCMLYDTVIKFIYLIYTDIYIAHDLYDTPHVYIYIYI